MVSACLETQGRGLGGRGCVSITENTVTLVPHAYHKLQTEVRAQDIPKVLPLPKEFTAVLPNS